MCHAWLRATCPADLGTFFEHFKIRNGSKNPCHITQKIFDVPLQGLQEKEENIDQDQKTKYLSVPRNR